MNFRKTAALAAAAVVLAGGLTLGVARAQMGYGGSMGGYQHEHHGPDHLDAALRALQTAQSELQQARHDDGGHRESALGYIGKAIQQVQQGISYHH